MAAVFIALALAVVAAGWLERSGKRSVADEGELLLRFQDLVLEYWPDLGIRTISKWQEPVRVAVVGKLPSRRAEQLDALARQFSAITGLTVIVARLPDEAVNLWIYSAPLSDWRDGKITVGPADRVGRGVSEQPETSFTVVDIGRIRSAAIYLAPADWPQMASVLPHELMHAFGLRGHAEPSFASITSGARWGGLTANDVIILQTLYDPRIEVGMAPGVVLQHARDIISKRRAH